MMIQNILNIKTIFLFIVILILSIIMSSCAPKIYLPKQNLNEIAGEVKNTKDDDIAPAKEKLLDCDNCANKIDSELPDSSAVMPSASYIDKLFIPEIFEDKELRDLRKRRTINVSQYTMSNKPELVSKAAAVKNMTANVESIYFISTNSGFASFSHPPSFEYLASQYLPFEKSEPKGGTDIFYFGNNNYDKIRFKDMNSINSPYWDSHPTAINSNNSRNECVTLLIFSSDRNNPFSKAINIAGDTIYGGSTDLYYSFAIFDPSLSIDSIGFKWTDVQSLTGANTAGFNEGSPFVYCQKSNPTLFFSSNRGNANPYDYDLYAAKIEIDFDNFRLSVVSSPELIDEKSPVTDSLTYRINTIADERFPYVPFPHLENAADNPLYFSSDRNRKRFMRACDCEPGNDRTENIGGYDLYKYPLPDKYNCPKPKIDTPKVYSPEIFADITVINLTNPAEEVKDAMIFIKDEEGNIVAESKSDKLYKKLEFGKRYRVNGGSSLNLMDCSSNREVIFRGYKSPAETYYETEQDSSIKIELLTGFSMNVKEFINTPKDISRVEKAVIFVKGFERPALDHIDEKIINARIENEMVFFEKQITTKKIWKKIDVRPTNFVDDFSVELALSASVRSVGTMNEKLFAERPESNQKIILHDTIYLLPDYIIKPPCYCEFVEILTKYQQNVPYFQTGFWEVNTHKNFVRDMNELSRFKFREARWVELHSGNQHFGEEKAGRQRRIYEYEAYSKVVDSNLIKMAEMISQNIIPVFKIIDSINPGSKLVISLDAWSDRRPVRRGWYIGDDVEYIEGTLNEGARDFDINFKRVLISDGSSLNLNNDTLSRLRAYNGYHALLDKLLDTNVAGRGFYDYYKSGLVLLPDDEKLLNTNLNLPFSVKSVEELIFNSKIILLAKGNYFDPTEYKFPKYIRDVDSSLFMLDTIRRIDVRINTLQYQAGKLIKSDCCNDLLPCIDYRKLLNLNSTEKGIIQTRRKKSK